MRYVPLISGRPPGATRPLGSPSLVSGIPANAAVWFEDFMGASIGSSLTGGHPNWVHTAIAGTGTCGNTTGSQGLVQLVTGATSGNTNSLDVGGRTTQIGTAISTTASTLGWNACWRVIPGATITNLNFGFGWTAASVAATAAGTDWITDPDTTLLGTTVSGTSLVITRHAASYSGDTAGALIARLYEATDTDSTSLELASSVTASTAVKVEVSYNAAAKVLTFYVNGTAVGTISTPSVSTWGMKPAMIAQTSTNASRTFGIDSYYQEVGQASAR